jgi:drug/metabolite transporter (DMT)-like permease
VVAGLSAALAAAALFGVAAVLQAVGSRRVPTESEVDPRRLVRFVGALLRQPAFVAALTLNLLGFVLHLVALRLLPLYLAQSGIAASLVVTALLATRVVGDRLGTMEWIAVVVVSVGLGLLAVSAGDAGDTGAGDGDGALTAGVGIGLLLIGGLGLLASRSTHAVATAVLGILAGLGFAGVAVSARLLPELSPEAVIRAPTAYTLVVSGGLAFLLYSLALQRGSVAVATAPMIALQTVTPAAVGVLLLGDEIRGGWQLGAAVGFTLSAVGSLMLVRFERIRED